MARAPCLSGSRARAGTVMRRSISARRSLSKTCSSPKASEAADVERARAFATTAFGDALTAVLCGAAVIAVMAGVVMQIGRLRLSRPTRVADDLDSPTRHCRLQ